MGSPCRADVSSPLASLYTVSPLRGFLYFIILCPVLERHAVVLGISVQMCGEDCNSDTQLVWIRNVLKKCISVWRQCEGEEKGCVFMHSSLTAALPPLALCSLCAELSACHWALSMSFDELTRSQPMRCVKAYLHFIFKKLYTRFSTACLTGFIKLYIQQI